MPSVVDLITTQLVVAVLCVFLCGAAASFEFQPRRHLSPFRGGPLEMTSSKKQNVEIPREERHKIRPSSLGSFAATAAMLPLVSVTVLPLSVAYQTGKYFLGGGPDSSSDHRQLDSGHDVAPSQRIPRDKRKYDMVVLGATGFTGGLAARYLAKTYGVDKTVKWAIAGRSQAKLDQVKSNLAEELADKDILNLDTIIVDTVKPDTLPELVKDTRCVATTAGPFSLYGNHVVEFCAKYGTHYVDITGEVDWVRSMIAHWQSTAQATGARLVPFCGHDSVPWDLLVMKLQTALQTDLKDELVTVTFWDDVKAEAPGGTLATVLAGVDGKMAKVPKCEFDPFLQLPNGEKSAYKVQANLPSFIAPSQSPWDVDSNQGKRWTIPFIMAGVNAKVVHWSYALRQQGSHKLDYTEMQVVPNFLTAFCYFFGQVILGTILLNPITNGLMKRFVLPKPGQGPSMNAMQHRFYLHVLAEGIGKAGNRVQAGIYFKKDPACLETARMMVESGLLLAQKEANLAVGGGFWSPSTALGDALLERILDDNTHFSCQTFPKEQQFQSKL